MKRVLPIAVLLAVLGAATGPAGAGSTPAAQPAVAQVLAPLGSPDDGHLAVAASLARIAREEQAEPNEDPLPGQRYPYRIPRTSVDRPDVRSGRQLHVVYLVPAGMPDDRFDEKGILHDSMLSQNVWMKQQTGNKQWRLDTFTFEWDDPNTFEEDPITIEAVDVTFIQSTRTSAQLDSVGEVDDELIAKGFNQANKRYLSYVAANSGGVCGDAFWSFDPRQDSFDGKYSDVYLYSSSGCNARQFAPNATQPSFSETIAMQEMIHNDGIVPPGAPHGCGPTSLPAHVCNPALIATPTLDPEYTDVMYPFVGLPLNQKKLDDDNLDYYGTPYPGIRDLDQGLYLETV